MRELTLMLLYLRFKKKKKSFTKQPILCVERLWFWYTTNLWTMRTISRGNHPSRSKSVYITEAVWNWQSFLSKYGISDWKQGVKIDLFEHTSSNGCDIANMNGRRQRTDSVLRPPNRSHLWSSGRVPENCTGCHQHRTHGYEQKAGCQNSDGYPAIAVKYGLLDWWLRYLPPQAFMEYEAVYLPKQPLYQKQKLCPLKNIWNFFPFDKLDVIKRGIESMWEHQNDRVMMALALTMTDKPMAVNMSFQREYAERYEWMEAAVHRLGVYLYQQFPLLWGLWYTERWNPAKMMQQSMAALAASLNLSYSSFG